MRSAISVLLGDDVTALQERIAEQRTLCDQIAEATASCVHPKGSEGGGSGLDNELDALLRSVREIRSRVFFLNKSYRALLKRKSLWVRIQQNVHVTYGDRCDRAAGPRARQPVGE